MISSFSPLLWLPHGYAMFNGPSMPIIGEGDVEPNDGYVPQLVASVKAAADEVAQRGVGDPECMAISSQTRR